MISNPRFYGAARQVSKQVSQCFRQKRLDAIRKNPLSHQMRQQRCKTTYQSSSKPSAIRLLFKAQPLAMTLACLSILAGVGSLVYVNFFYHDYIIGAFKQYPEAVAKPMRKALFYTNYQVDPQNALKYYKEALRVADEVGMDPFSDEIIGIKIQVAYLMEKIGQYERAIDVLEIVKSDNEKWQQMVGQASGKEAQRLRVLKWSVKISVKLGELYGSPYVLDPEMAEASLVWAIETIMKERLRREREGLNTEVGDDDWVSDQEQGAAFEDLAGHYEAKDLWYLAAPLYLKALEFSNPVDCHTSVLMNNLAISLAQQRPASSESNGATSQQLLDNARSWSEKAIAVAARMKPPQRTEECDTSCAVATYNLGSFAEWSGNLEEARKKFIEAKSLSTAIGFKEGVAQAEEGLERLYKAQNKV